MKFIAIIALSLTTTLFSVFAAEEDITIRGNAGTRIIPIAISGFSGEADSVLKFDLFMAGFEVTAPEKAQYLLTGKNNGNVEGRLTDAINKGVIAQQAFSGGSTRVQAHALADTVISAITHQPPIAQTKIAFKVDQEGGSEIYVSDYDGHNATAVTRDHAPLVNGPCWVPGARKLYYASWKSGRPQIFSHDLTSGDRQVFARYPGSNISPAISPDGKQMAMILTKEGSPDLYVCDISGSNLKQLTRTRDEESSPCWSPNNRTICFVSTKGGKAGLYTIDAGGGESRRLSTIGVAGHLTEPDWSPDGRTIIFTAQMGGFNVCTIPAAGGTAQILVEGEDPSWAPNSRTVVFTRREGSRRVLSLLDVPTKRMKDVTKISGSCSQAGWQKSVK